jgi:predicted O-methyltransferase YrrM
LYPDALTVLNALKQRGTRLAVVSNWPRGLESFCHEMTMAHFFDAVIASADFGVEKPDPRVLGEALRLLHASPESVVHVGDAMDQDIAGALNGGLRAILLDRQGVYSSVENRISSLSELDALLSPAAAQEALSPFVHHECLGLKGLPRLLNTPEMNDSEIARVPPAVEAIEHDAQKIGFTMGSERRTGSFLRTLAAMKPAGRILELGTGTGMATAWLLAGMDASSKLDSVDRDPAVQEIAKRHLGYDNRVTFHLAEGAEFLANARTPYDLIFADSWAGKFDHLNEALALLRVGGIYLIDDLLPQPNWPEDHAPKVPALINDLESRDGFEVTRLDWASGLMIVVRKAAF